MIYMFSKNVGVRDSNKAEVLAILEALWIISACFQVSLLVEKDLSKCNIMRDTQSL